MAKGNDTNEGKMLYQQMPQITTAKGQNEGQALSGREIEFAVFCIENIAAELKIAGDEAYQMLAVRSNILDEYVIANYEVLHTQSKEYIIRDVIDYMKEQGVIK